MNRPKVEQSERQNKLNRLIISLKVRKEGHPDVKKILKKIEKLAKEIKEQNN